MAEAFSVSESFMSFIDSLPAMVSLQRHFGRDLAGNDYRFTRVRFADTESLIGIEVRAAAEMAYFSVMINDACSHLCLRASSSGLYGRLRRHRAMMTAKATLPLMPIAMLPRISQKCSNLPLTFADDEAMFHRYDERTISRHAHS